MLTGGAGIHSFCGRHMRIVPDVADPAEPERHCHEEGEEERHLPEADEGVDEVAGVLLEHVRLQLGQVLGHGELEMKAEISLINENFSYTGSLSHLRTKLPESSSCPQPAQRPNHATWSLLHSKTQYCFINFFLDSAL